MICIGGCDFIHVAATVEIHVLRCRNSRLQRVFIANTMQTAVCIDLLFVNGFDGCACKKPRLNAGAHLARRRNNSACCLLVLRISFLASSIGSVRTGVSVRVCAGGGVGVRVMTVSFSTKIPSFHTIAVEGSSQKSGSLQAFSAFLLARVVVFRDFVGSLVASATK
jgi:hypothetical protein